MKKVNKFKYKIRNNTYYYTELLKMIIIFTLVIIGLLLIF
jgi:hypothetical protein